MISISFEKLVFNAIKAYKTQVKLYVDRVKLKYLLKHKFLYKITKNEGYMAIQITTIDVDN